MVCKGSLTDQGWLKCFFFIFNCSFFSSANDKCLIQGVPIIMGIKWQIRSRVCWTIVVLPDFNYHTKGTSAMKYKVTHKK